MNSLFFAISTFLLFASLLNGRNTHTHTHIQSAFSFKNKFEKKANVKNVSIHFSNDVEEPQLLMHFIWLVFNAADVNH